MDIPAATLQRQHNASHPRACAWVSANAGAGKTFVLARRVVRLLLGGADPSRLLCLTFTKAAAAQMAVRVFDTLAQWVAMDDETLRNAILDMGEPEPGVMELARARRLFATALESPGGLKIQTIHAFCEALLHQFPLEANVAGHFAVLDDRERSELLAQARARVLQEAAEDASAVLGRALAHLITCQSDATVSETLDEIVARRDDLARWVGRETSLENALGELARAFGVTPGETSADCDARILGEGLEPERRKAIAEALRTGSTRDGEKAERLIASIEGMSEATRRAAYISAFLTQKGTPFKPLVTKAVMAVYPDVGEAMAEEAERLVAIFEHRRAVATIEGTAAFMRLAEAVVRAYEHDKRRLGRLDFDDLIVRTANLLKRADAAPWVQYKLDQGLDHILIDEAQDTSPRQWEVIEALAEEFFVGEGARTVTRTLFAVGDEKQSIYSFQGAVPAYFAEMRTRFSRRARDGGGTFHDVQLTLSFRSTRDVLGAVDLVFADEAVRAGLSRDGEALVHEAVRRNDPGLVEVWPLLAAQKGEPPDDWRQPLDHEGAGSPMVRLAERIALMLAAGREAGTLDPGEVLVLVRKRGAFVAALDRALKAHGVPVAGADRIVLSEHIAVQDLVALGRFVLLPEDDLSLACLLKSPLFGFDDDDLLALAHDRGERTLWRTMRERGDEKPVWRLAVQTLERWRARADFVPPYEFYARILGEEGGRRRMRARLGREVDDVLDEFLSLSLDFERTGVPGLEGFLAWLTAASTQVKREMEAAGSAVRVMTVHGAKGLEAPVVFLVDTGSAPSHSSHDPQVLPFALNDDPLAPPALVWKPAASDQTQWHAEAIARVREAAEQEYRRLLYVAMTRARDRLVVCGWAAPKSGAHEGCWHALVDRALAPTASEITDATGEVIARHWRMARTGASDGGADATATLDARPATAREPSQVTSARPALPAWLSQPAPAHVPARRLSPSRALDLIDGELEEMQPRHTLEAALDANHWGLVRGQIVHRLLQSLPDIDAQSRVARAQVYLERALDERFADRRESLLAEIFAVLGDPGFAAVFSDASQAEVPLVGTLSGKEGAAYAVSGQIDRLAVTPDSVLIVDYKTNANPPQELASVPLDYVAQLGVYRLLVAALYPDRPVRAALLWTAAPRLMEIPAEMLDRAAGALT